MARSIDKERQDIEVEEARLAERKRLLAQREADEVLAILKRSPLVRLDAKRAKAIVDRIGKLGIEEVEKRLA